MIIESKKLPGSKRARTRDQLLVSAQELLMDHPAAALGIRQITEHGGVVHGTFYNYYQDVTALIADLAELLGASHAAMMIGLQLDLSDPAMCFSRITRQTLRMVASVPDFGRLVFDVGLPPDSLVSELRLRLRSDMAQGVRLGCFRVADLDLATSLVSGAISGLALDLHRGVLPLAAIEPATAQLLEWLGLEPGAAAALGHEDIVFAPAPIMPMRWLALPPLPPAKPGDR